MSVYYMKNIKEMVKYAGTQTKSIIVRKKLFSNEERQIYTVEMYEDLNFKGYSDSVHVNKRTLKAYLRRFSSLSSQELDNELYRIGATYQTPKYEEDWEGRINITFKLA